MTPQMISPYITFNDLLHTLRESDLIDPKVDKVRFNFDCKNPLVTNTCIFMELLRVYNVYNEGTKRLRSIEYKDICRALENNTTVDISEIMQ